MILLHPHLKYWHRILSTQEVPSSHWSTRHKRCLPKHSGKMQKLTPTNYQKWKQYVNDIQYWIYWYIFNLPNKACKRHRSSRHYERDSGLWLHQWKRWNGIFQYMVLEARVITLRATISLDILIAQKIVRIVKPISSVVIFVFVFLSFSVCMLGLS